MVTWRVMDAIGLEWSRAYELNCNGVGKTESHRWPFVGLTKILSTTWRGRVCGREREIVCVCVCMCACMCVCVFINHTPVDLLLHSESILRTWMVQIIHFWTISSAVQFYYNYIINYTLISARWCHSIWHHQVVVVILSNPQVILDLTIKKLCSRLKLL